MSVSALDDWVRLTSVLQMNSQNLKQQQQRASITIWQLPGNYKVKEIFKCEQMPCFTYVNTARFVFSTIQFNG